MKDDHIIHARTVNACRACGGPVDAILELGTSPIANRLGASATDRFASYPLGLSQCRSCSLVQNSVILPTSELFSPDYPYRSATSAIVRENAAGLSAAVAARLPEGARALDVGSNDGTTQLALASQGIRCFGVDPARAAVEMAQQSGCEALCAPFDAAAAQEVIRRFGSVDVVTMSNVLAHVPDPAALLDHAITVLRPGGQLVIEVQSWAALVGLGAFDMVYHEHHAHFSLAALLTLLGRCGFGARSVEETPAQGGSLRVWCRPGRNHAPDVIARAEAEALALEKAPECLRARVAEWRASADHFVALQRGRNLAGYGAAAKTVTLMAAYGGDFGIRRIADRAPSKIGLHLPLNGIPIVAPETMLSANPEAILLFAWNLADEIVATLGDREVWVPFPVFRRVA